MEVINGSNDETQVFHEPKTAVASRGQRKTAPAATSVEVIDGSARSTVVLNPPKPAGMAQAEAVHGRGLRSPSGKGEPSASEVEVINGSDIETKELKGAALDTAGPWGERRSAPPVVLRVISSDTKPVGAIAGQQPVVVGVGSNRSNSTQTAPVVVGLAPRLPRPEYQP